MTHRSERNNVRVPSCQSPLPIYRKTFYKLPHVTKEKKDINKKSMAPNLTISLQ